MLARRMDGRSLPLPAGCLVTAGADIARETGEAVAALLAARFNPKPPRWWIEEQLLEEKRDSKTAGIVWNTAYKPQRKFLIWSQASDEDFREHEYLR
jgi:hypothetical protein